MAHKKLQWSKNIKDKNKIKYYDTWNWTLIKVKFKSKHLFTVARVLLLSSPEEAPPGVVMRVDVDDVESQPAPPKA